MRPFEPAYTDKDDAQIAEVEKKPKADPSCPDSRSCFSSISDLGGWHTVHVRIKARATRGQSSRQTA